MIVFNAVPESYVATDAFCVTLHIPWSDCIFSKTSFERYPKIIAITKTTNNMTNSKKGVNLIPFINLIYSIVRKY